MKSMVDQKRIVVDITTTMNWQGTPVGITRTEKNYAKYLYENCPIPITFCFYDRSLKEFIELSRDKVENVLYASHESLENIGKINKQTIVKSKVKSVLSNLDRNIKSHLYNFKTTCPPLFEFLREIKHLIVSFKHLEEALIRYCKNKIVNITSKKSSLKRWNIFTFHPTDLYISMGLDWDYQDKMKALWEKKKLRQFYIVLFCYDVLCVKYPQFVPKDYGSMFVEYLTNAIWCADKIICISNNTCDDLKKFIEQIGCPRPEFRVVQLGSNLKKTEKLIPPSSAPFLKGQKFVLFVSTIEARKNHQLLYRVWVKLLEKHPNNEVPFLVFVGLKGWLVDELLYSVESDLRVKNKIVLLHGINDSELVWLYKKCLFTVFPSYYEGWGIPVAESLEYGKMCLSSNGGSLTEIAPDIDIYIDPVDTFEWLRKIEGFLQHPEKVKNIEKLIKKKYKAISWNQSGRQLLQAILK